MSFPTLLMRKNCIMANSAMCLESTPTRFTMAWRDFNTLDSSLSSLSLSLSLSSSLSSFFPSSPDLSSSLALSADLTFLRLSDLLKTRAESWPRMGMHSLVMENHTIQPSIHWYLLAMLRSAAVRWQVTYLLCHRKDAHAEDEKPKLCLVRLLLVLQCLHESQHGPEWTDA